MKPRQSAAVGAAMVAVPTVALFGAIWWKGAHRPPEFEVRDGVSYFHGARCRRAQSGLAMGEGARH